LATVIIKHFHRAGIENNRYLVGKRNNPWRLVSVLVGLYIGQKNQQNNKQTDVKTGRGRREFRVRIELGRDE